MSQIFFGKWKNGFFPFEISELNPGEGEEHDWKDVTGSEGGKFEWPTFNERVYAPDGTYRPAFVTHMRANVKYSPKKLW